MGKDSDLVILFADVVGSTRLFEALGDEAARDIVATGTSSDRQRAVYQDAIEAEMPVAEALHEVVRHLMAEFHEGL
jgi:carboxylate-amine ligase